VLNQELNHILFKYKRRKLITRPILGAEHMRLSTFNTPSKRLMKERSSPGLRHSIASGGFDSEKEEGNR